jgi:ElaA protein
MISWQWKTFDEFSVRELYQLLRLRAEVFVVEQDAAYQDLDNLDYDALHLLGWEKDSTGTPAIVAHSRVVARGVKYSDATSIGRVVIAKPARGKGLGYDLMNESIAKLEQVYPNQPIRISAQDHLNKFYGTFGFEQVSEPYVEDGIPHIEMLRKA